MEQAIKLYASEGTLIPLGRVGEKRNIQVYFDIENLIKEGGTEGTCWLYLSHNTWTYPTATLEVVDDKWAVWTPAEALFSFSGRGRCELSYEVGSEYVGKSPTYHYVVLSSLSEETSEDPPTPVVGWIEEIRETASRIESVGDEVETAVDAAAEAKGYAEAASASATAAEGHVTAAETAQGLAETAQQKAESAQGLAETAQGLAETAQGKAEDAQGFAETAQGKAEDAQGLAEIAQGKAEDAQEAAEKAQGLAETAQGLAETAQGLAETAQEKAETAQGKAEDAQGLAETAQQKAETAQGLAETAQQKAEAAKGLAEEANNSAGKSAEAASTSATNASGSADAAAASATAAATSATNASTSEKNASTSEKNASNSAVAAKNSEDAAALSASGASDSAKAAQDAQKIAEDSAALAVQYSGNPAIPRDGTWWIWDSTIENTETGTFGAYKDTGIRSILAITKTYPSVSAMEADLLNMPVGDLVLISTSTDVEDNAKLYIRGESGWEYLSDLSGVQGTGISEVKRTSGDGSPGTKDTYTITLTDNRAFTFDVYNGSNGIDGVDTGDMAPEDYDPDGEVLKSGGIPNYVKENASKTILKSWTAADFAE